MALTISPHSINKKHPYFQRDYTQKMMAQLKNTLESSDIGFFRLDSLEKDIENIEKIKTQFSDRTHFVLIGIGGSSLGAETLVHALKKNSKKIYFVNNVDPVSLNNILKEVPIGKTLFNFVSKSGNTAETLATLVVIQNFLLSKQVLEENLKEHFVFTTTLNKGDLFKFGKKYDISMLSMPENIGGRFSVLTSVGLFPAAFAGIDLKKVQSGHKKFVEKVPLEDILQISATLLYLKEEEGIDQTVLMPYSDQLKVLSFWFTQLWAESLGKKHSYSQEVVHQGLTPIPAYGATDQHSQMQLFVEGPRDKALFFIEVKNFDVDFSTDNNIPLDNFKPFVKKTLSQLFSAELTGTLDVFKEIQRPFFHFSIDCVNEENLTQLLLFFEVLTASMAQHLNINAFNQPGVEKGKIYAYKYLQSLPLID